MPKVYMNEVPVVQTVGAGGIGVDPPVPVEKVEKISGNTREMKEVIPPANRIPNPITVDEGASIKEQNQSWQAGAPLPDPTNATDGMILAVEDGEYQIVDASVQTDVAGLVADPYSTESTYDVGNVVVYNNKTYRCITPITQAEAWTAAHWEEKNIAEIEQADYSDLKTGYVLDRSLSAATAAAPADLVGAFSFTNAMKAAILSCFSNVAWASDHGQDYYDALEEALYGSYFQIFYTLVDCTVTNNIPRIAPLGSYSTTIVPASGMSLSDYTVAVAMGGIDITSTAYNNGSISIASVTGALEISATVSAVSISTSFAQGGNYIWSDDSLDSLKQYLTVTAQAPGGSTFVVDPSLYTLSGSLSTAQSTITASFSGQTSTFTVSVTLVGNTEYASALISCIINSPYSTYSNGEVKLDAKDLTHANSFNAYIINAGTLFNTVQNKTLRLRVSIRCPDWQEQSAVTTNNVTFGAGVFKGTVSAWNDVQKFTGFDGFVNIPSDYVTKEEVLVASVSNMQWGSGTPNSSSKFGVFLNNNTLSVCYVKDFSVKEVLS